MIEFNSDEIFFIYNLVKKSNRERYGANHIGNQVEDKIKALAEGSDTQAHINIGPITKGVELTFYEGNRLQIFQEGKGCFIVMKNVLGFQEVKFTLNDTETNYLYGQILKIAMGENS